MKRTIFIGILMLTHYYGSTCTIIPDAFCRTLVTFPENVVLTGIIVAIDSTGIDIEVLEILRGEESRDTIRVWDGTDFDCNGIWSMAASDIGALHDTVILILPRIVEIENVWDIIGDYRRPEPYSETTELKVKEGNANGFISGDALAPPEYNLWTMNYEDFKNSIIEDGDCSSIILATANAESPPTISINNPFASHLIVQLHNEVKKGYIKLYSMTGYVYLHTEINAESVIEMEVSAIPPGMYLVEVTSKGRRETIKVIKQNY